MVALNFHRNSIELNLANLHHFKWKRFSPHFLLTISLITILSLVLAITNFIWRNQFLSFRWEKTMKKHLTRAFPFENNYSGATVFNLFPCLNSNLRCKFHSTEQNYDPIPNQNTISQLLTHSHRHTHTSKHTMQRWEKLLPSNFISFFRCILLVWMCHERQIVSAAYTESDIRKIKKYVSSPSFR